jgi:hypothetical protein
MAVAVRVAREIISGKRPVVVKKAKYVRLKLDFIKTFLGIITLN